ncbi:MAG: hypothetical protein H6669_15260 [Ardenticatenaceae bacterium]|nr:hypothetical protein [Ardenticatenaceae bacterium]
MITNVLLATVGRVTAMHIPQRILHHISQSNGPKLRFNENRPLTSGKVGARLLDGL